MLLNYGVGNDSWEFLGLQGDPTSPSWRKSVLNIHWKDWCWSWSSNTLATWCGELTHWKRPWCWERLKAGGEGGDREWVGWMASPSRWTQLWASSGSWWWTERPGVLQSMGFQRVGCDWATELNWTEGFRRQISKSHCMDLPGRVLDIMSLDFLIHETRKIMPTSPYLWKMLYAYDHLIKHLPNSWDPIIYSIPPPFLKIEA